MNRTIDKTKDKMRFRNIVLENGIEVIIDAASYSRCRSCGADIVWSKTLTGRTMPIDIDLKTSHFATCPQSRLWRKKK